MSVARSQNVSLRPKVGPLVWAFVISLTIHALLFGGYKLGQRYELWNKSLLPAWLKKSLAALKPVEMKPRVNREPPLLFVDVSPAQAVTEAPKDTKYYSALNSKAANPEAQTDSNVPKITGNQTQVPKTEDVPRTKQFPLQPTPPEAPKPESAEPRPKTDPTPGDLALGKPAPKPDKYEPPAPERERPRRLADVKPPPGEKMKQDGGVKRRLEISSVDAKATAFGAYDALFIAAVSSRWYSLLDSRDFARDRTGKVVVEFRLNHDGRITEMKEVENDVGELLGLICQKAVLDPAPFEKWPSDLRRLVGADYREVRFTFFYN